MIEELLTELLPEPGENAARILHSGDEWAGQPYLLLNDSGAEICAGTSDRPDVGITVDPNLGTQIHGAFAISEMPENIAIASYWTLNPMLLACIGSSAAMPIPTLVWSKPRILQASADMASIGSGLGV